jgi:alpha-galactosidase
MLEIGAMAWNDGVTRLTENEAIFAYSLRAFFLSPIQLSCRLDKLSEFEKDLICNEEIIKISQDSLSDYPELMYISDDKKVEVYSRTLEDGDKAIAIFNMAEEEITHILDLEDYRKVRNLWTKTDMEVAREFSCVVEPHCAIILRMAK